MFDHIPDTEFVPLLSPALDGWRMAGDGRFFWTDDGVLESEGGHGLFWYADALYADLALRVEWRCRTTEDNSGVFLRIPALWDHDLNPAIREGYEVQIDDRGVAPDGSQGSPLHLTGSVYALEPVTERAFRPLGAWNRFEVMAVGDRVSVCLNGTMVCRLEGGNRRRDGHVALQAHHPGSQVQFRNLCAARL